MLIKDAKPLFILRENEGEEGEEDENEVGGSHHETFLSKLAKKTGKRGGDHRQNIECG